MDTRCDIPALDQQTFERAKERGDLAFKQFFDYAAYVAHVESVKADMDRRYAIWWEETKAKFKEIKQKP